MKKHRHDWNQVFVESLEDITFDDGIRFVEGYACTCCNAKEIYYGSQKIYPIKKRHNLTGIMVKQNDEN